MKNISNVGKKNTVKNNNKGFTLVELLATVAILSLVVTVVIFVAINVINNAKESSYKVTISNVEEGANSYVLEEISLINWMNISGTNLQYQCVTVQNLIDSGYFKGDVLESDVSSGVKLNANNYVYIERNKNTKTITKDVLLVGDKLGKYGELCSNINALGSISFDMSPYGWSTYKNVSINYQIFNNLDKVSNYTYSYYFVSNSGNNDKSGSSNFINSYSTVNLSGNDKIVENGNLIASIKDKDGNEVVTSTLTISKIDNENPVAMISSTNNVASKQKLTLSMSDNVGVIAYYFGKDNPNTKTVTWTQVNQTKTLTVETDVSSSGTYYLAVKDVVGHISTVNKVFYQTNLSISNATVSPNKVITMSGKEWTIPTPSVNVDYKFMGWYKKSDYSGNAITKYKPTSNTTLYGKTVYVPKVYIKYDTNGGVVTSSTNGGDWTTDSNGIISLNGSEFVLKISYGSKTIDTGLANYNNSSYLNIKKTGYSAVSKKEWICLSGCSVSNKTFDQSVVYKSSDFCDNGDKDCTVVLGVNWKANTYKIKYDGNGGTASATSKDVTYGLRVGTLATATRTGYSFKEWNTKKDGSGTKYTSDTVYNVDGDTTLYAIWNANTYKINFDGNGGEVSKTSQNVTYGKKVGTLATATNGTAQFLGWNTKKDGSGTKYTSDTVYNVDGDTTLYAIWKSMEYTITYIGNGGGYAPVAESNKKYCKATGEVNPMSGNMETTTCTYGESCTLATNKFSIQCQKFMGWTTKSDTDATDYTNNVTYKDGQTFTYNIQGDLTLYAVWKSDHNWNAIGNQLTDTGGEFECGHIHTEAYMRYCSKCHMSVAHYNFCYKPTYQRRVMTMYCPCSWQEVVLNDFETLNSSGNNLTAIDSVTAKKFGGVLEGNPLMTKVKSSNRVYVCVEHYHTLKFDANGGSVSTTSKTVSYKSPVGELPTPTRSGYYFNGWNTKADGSGTTYTSDTKLASDSNLTLYAQWGTAYKITLNQVSPTTAGTSTIYFKPGSGAYKDAECTTKMTTSDNGITVPRKTGFVFGGYYTAALGKGTLMINSSGKLSSNFTDTYYSSDATLYAKWTKTAGGITPTPLK